MKDKRILIIDDDQDIRESLAALLELEQYQIDTCPSAEAALAYLDAHDPPDLILLDLAMPMPDGYEFRKRQLLLDPPWCDIPVIVVSAVPLAQQEKHQLQANATVCKPLSDVTILEAAIRRWTE